MKSNSDAERTFFKFLSILEDGEGKGCKLCCICRGWMGPPFEFHKEWCSAGIFMRKAWEYAYPEYEIGHREARKEWPWVR